MNTLHDDKLMWVAGRHLAFLATLFLFVFNPLFTTKVDAADSVSPPLPISDLTPYTPPPVNKEDPADVTQCMGPEVVNNAAGVNYRNSEAEAQLAVNPTNPNNIIAVWIQDRWSTGGGGLGLGAAFTKDGGQTWEFVNVPFTRCSGGTVANNGDFERATDPWVAFGPDGAAYFVALAYSPDVDGDSAFTVAKSLDGGETWSDPIVIYIDPSLSSINSIDKQSLTTDPNDPDFLYFTGHNFPLRGKSEIEGTNRGRKNNVVFTRSTDGGLKWEPLRVIVNTPPSEFTQCSQIAVVPPSFEHPEGILVNAFVVEPHTFAKFPSSRDHEMTIVRSFDKGVTWTEPQVVAIWVPSVVAGSAFVEGGAAVDEELDITFRSQAECLDLAVGPLNGHLYMVWEDARFNPTGLIGSVIITSTDGGETWSSPLPVNPDTLDVQTFYPAVTVNNQGIVGVLYYDFRNDNLGDSTLDTDVFLARFEPQPGNQNEPLRFLSEDRLTPVSFDSRQYLLTSGFFPGYFAGDYSGLEGSGSDFAAAYVITNSVGVDAESDFPVDTLQLEIDSRNRQDVVFSLVH
jgi:hypothetical protein